MNCNQVLGRLEDFVDGGLDAAAAGEVRSHVRDCPSCADELAELRDLRDRVAGLPPEIMPRRDLWPGIEARLSGPRPLRDRFVARAVLALAAALVMAATAIIAYRAGTHRPAVVSGAVAAPQGSRQDVVRASFSALGVTDYAETRGQLLKALEARRGELAPETLELVMDNLALIDGAMAKIAVALGNDPGNELLQRQLVNAYRRQIDLLERAVVLPAEV